MKKTAVVWRRAKVAGRNVAKKGFYSCYSDCAREVELLVAERDHAVSSLPSKKLLEENILNKHHNLFGCA